MDREVLEQVKQANDILDVVQSYLGPMKRAGANYIALSPFQKEKTPSFNVLPDRQIFKCFSSGHGGDVIKFVQLYENLDFMGAVRLLAERAGISLPDERNPRSREERSRREQLLEVHSEVALWWKTLLWKDSAGAPGREYLNRRQISRELADTFGLGFAPDSWSAVIDWGRDKGFNAELLEAAGLLSMNESGRRYDRFRGRLMFPIEDEAGRVIAFSGRVLDPDAKAAKYINSPETDLFHKSKVLYGLGKTKRDIMAAKHVVICEGQIDLMRCYDEGLKHVAAPLGTAFTAEHGRLIKRFAERVTLCFDSDRAGLAAAERSVDTLLEAGLDIRIAGLPPGDDPDTLLLGPQRDEFLSSVEDAPDYVTHILEMACQSVDIENPRARGEVAAKMAPIVLSVADPITRHAVSLNVASRLRVPLEAFQAEIEKAEALRSRKKRYETARFTEDDQPPPQETLLVHEIIEALVTLLLTRLDLIPEVARRLRPEWLDGLPGSHLLTRLIELHADDALHDAGSYMEACTATESNHVAGLLATDALQTRPNLAKDDDSPASTNHQHDKDQRAPDTEEGAKDKGIRKELLMYYEGLESSQEDLANRILDKARDLWLRRQIHLLQQDIKAGGCTPEELLSKTQQLLELKNASLPAAAE